MPEDTGLGLHSFVVEGYVQVGNVQGKVERFYVLEGMIGSEAGGQIAERW